MPESEYISALIDDISQYAAILSSRPICSIFIGGGTPSLFSAESFSRLFESIHKLSLLSEEIEVTMEANPSSVEAARFKAYRQIGINRLSLGVQSFDDSSLKCLGRVHDSDMAKQAIVSILDAGFENFNIDIMHGLPNQSVDMALDDLKQALSFNPTHLSWYQLTIEPNTYFYRYKPELPGDDTLGEIEANGKALLSKQLKQYEISAFCRGNQQAKHNLNYWRFGDYIGIGAGAHGKITLDEEIIRTQKKRVPKDYLHSQKASTRRLDEEQLLFEFMLNHVRLFEPIPKKRFEQRTRLSRDVITWYINKAVSKGLMTDEGDAWHVTPLGHRFLNDLQALFL